MANPLDEHRAERRLEIVRKYMEPIARLGMLNSDTLDAICQALVAETIKTDNIPVRVSKQMS
jgi:hypothetical protein